MGLPNPKMLQAPGVAPQVQMRAGLGAGALPSQGGLGTTNVGVGSTLAPSVQAAIQGVTGQKLPGVRPIRAEGGGVRKPRATRFKFHSGPIHSHVAGRTDHLPMHVESGSYVLPADLPSGYGEGNTVAGFKLMRRVFGGNPYKQGAQPYGQSGGPYGEPLSKASGGSTDGVPIVAAGGEYVLTPEQVRRVGGGDLETGHRVLDEFVKRSRKELIKTLSKLPGPAKG